MEADKKRRLRVINTRGKEPKPENCQKTPSATDSVNSPIHLPDINKLKSAYEQLQQKDAHSLTDKELVICCLNSAWNSIYWTEFHERYDRAVINIKIIKTLREKYFPTTKDTIDENRMAIYEKLRKENFLAKSFNNPNFVAWLKTVVANAVRDRVKHQKRKKNAAGYNKEKTKKSLDEPKNQRGNGPTLGENAPDPKTDPQNTESGQWQKENAEHLLQAAESLSETQKYIFKVNMMFYRPLSDQDIREIARKRQVPEQVIEQAVEEIEDDLSIKNAEYEKRLNDIIIQNAYLERLERRLKHLTADPYADLKEVARVVKDIEVQIRQLENKRKRLGGDLVLPSAEQIARLLGIKQSTVGARLCEARAYLRQMKDELL